MSVNDKDVCNELKKYIVDDFKLEELIEYTSYNEDIIEYKKGNVLFVEEINIFCGEIINNQTKEILDDSFYLNHNNLFQCINDTELFLSAIFDEKNKNYS